LCVQPEEAVPRDDQVAMRYLLVTADEERLLKVANPIAFGFLPLVRMTHHDLSQRYAAPAAALLTLVMVGFCPACLAGEIWALFQLDSGGDLILAAALLLAVPAIIWLVLLVLAGVAPL